MTRPPGGGERRTGPALEVIYPLVRWLIPTVDRFPRRQKFLLGDRLRSTALDGLARLVEATFTRDRSRLLNQVNVDLDKLRLLLRLARELGHLDARRYEHGARRPDEVGRLVGGWRRAHREAERGASSRRWARSAPAIDNAGFENSLPAFDSLACAGTRGAAPARTPILVSVGPSDARVQPAVRCNGNELSRSGSR